jgi:hypothetical protein
VLTARRSIGVRGKNAVFDEANSPSLEEEEVAMKTRIIFEKNQVKLDLMRIERNCNGY